MITIFTIQGTPSRGDQFTMGTAHRTLDDALKGVYREISTYAVECGASFDRETMTVTDADGEQAEVTETRFEPEGQDRAVEPIARIDAGDCEYFIYQHNLG